jgi:hypothetical protein
MVATQRVNLFGRDQESCDHVLGNPSVSRKHAAVIHDNEGGIYVRDWPWKALSMEMLPVIYTCVCVSVDGGPNVAPRNVRGPQEDPAA